MLLYVRLIATFFAQPGHARCSDAPCGSGGLPVSLRVVGHGLSVELGEALAGHRLAATAGGYLFKNGVRVYLFKNGARVNFLRMVPGCTFLRMVPGCTFSEPCLVCTWYLMIRRVLTQASTKKRWGVLTAYTLKIFRKWDWFF